MERRPLRKEDDLPIFEREAVLIGSKEKSIAYLYKAMGDYRERRRVNEVRKTFRERPDIELLFQFILALPEDKREEAVRVATSYLKDIQKERGAV